MTSDDNVVSNGFAAKLAAAQQRLGVAQPAVPAQQQTPAQGSPNVPEEDIPQLGYERDPRDIALDDAIKNLSILKAYDIWCGKMKPVVGNKREGIHISCPNPSHADVNPSAWVNIDKNLYHCSGCEYGGDVWDIAAFAFGFPVPGYKSDPAAFRKLREMMALDLGFSIVKGYSGTFVVPPEDEQDGSSEEEEAQATPSSMVAAPSPVQQKAQELSAPVDPAPVGKLPSAVEHELNEEERKLNEQAPSISWRDWIPESTFLRSWLDATTQDDCPEEYHVWTGLMAIGFALGRKKVLWDLRPVVGNLFACLVGPSGARKSQAVEHLTTVVDLVFPWSSSSHSGVKHVRSPGSAEYLVQSLSDVEEDPSNPSVQIHHPVRALIEFGELSTLMGIGSRAGSVLKPQLMDIYDAKKSVGSGSLTHGERYAREPFGQCISTTQNDSLNRLLDKGDDASGFMNRWIFAGGMLKPARALGGVRVDLGAPAALLNQIYVWTYTGSTEVEWSPQAVELWTEFFHSTLHPAKVMANQNGSAMLNRIDLLMKKLILLFTANVMSDVVPKAAVEQAIKLYPYLLQTFGVVSAQLARTEDSDLRERVTSAIEKLTAANGQGPTKREIFHAVKKSIKTVDQLGKLLRNMVDLEIIKEVVPARKPGQRGQLGVRYAVAN